MPTRPSPRATDHVAVPPSGSGAGVLVIHAWWGLTGFVRGVCDRLAAEGFVAHAPDLFEGQVAATPTAAGRLRATRRREPASRTLLRAVEALASHPATRGPAVGVVGFSMGGHWALWLAQRPELPIGAVVTYYGARSGDYSRSRAAVQGHFAERDEWVSAAAVRTLARRLEAAGRPAELHVYPGTGHWFAEADREDAYRPEAAELAWTRTVAFLRAQLGDRAARRRRATS